MFVRIACFACLLISLIIGVLTDTYEDDDNYIYCAQYQGAGASYAEGAPENASRDSSLRCEKGRNYCYTVWQVNSDNGTVVIYQGCWQSASTECDREECIADKKPPKSMNHTKFCCCSTNNCNFNFTDAYVEQPEMPKKADDGGAVQSKASVNPIIYIVVGVVFVVFVIVLTAILYWCWRMRPKKSDVENGQHQLPPPEEYSLEKLKLLNVVGQGRYGSVWRGVVEDQEVAVKVFPAHHRNYFLNEHDMYKVAGEHSCLLKCFGGGEFPVGPNGLDYVLLLSLEQECVQDYLRSQTLDLPALSRMTLGIAKGLSHLHSDLGKPCIAHRDINTRNILVRRDLTCCVCDLGLAVVPRRAENKAISEAGTSRYMAPEVLEGAVNLQDCESALKQMDVYALGLVLWELGSRCSDMQNAEPQPYAPPFYKEVGENPSLEQMQTLISRRKVRPLWPISWKDTAAARLLCETAEDCWDQDAEARLTALCVVERLLELPTLKGRALHPMHPPASPTSLINNNHLHDHQIDATVGTVETLLSPSEENCKNSNQLAACKTPLQPYQGRNPCMERNLLSDSSDSLLIDKSAKHCGSSESQSLIPNEFLNFQMNHRAAAPIPYVQNAVYGFPKQLNTAAAGGDSAKLKFKWYGGLRNIFNSRKNSSSNNVCRETQVKLNGKVVNRFARNDVTTSLLKDEPQQQQERPSSLALDPAPNNCGVSQIIKRQNDQRSLERFSEVFSSTSDLSRLKDPSQRVKTPGDVPPSVRRTRGKAAADSAARFSLYDDRMMSSSRSQWCSAPDLEPPSQQTTNDPHDRDSVSSF